MWDPTVSASLDSPHCAPLRRAGVATEVMTSQPSSAHNCENGSATASPEQNSYFVLQKAHFSV